MTTGTSLLMASIDGGRFFRRHKPPRQGCRHPGRTIPRIDCDPRWKQSASRFSCVTASSSVTFSMQFGSVAQRGWRARMHGVMAIGTLRDRNAADRADAPHRRTPGLGDASAQTPMICGRSPRSMFKLLRYVAAQRGVPLFCRARHGWRAGRSMSDPLECFDDVADREPLSTAITAAADAEAGPVRSTQSGRGLRKALRHLPR